MLPFYKLDTFAEMAAKLSVLVDKLALKLSTGRKVDGLWIGTMESKPRLGLRRVEEALELIKRNDSVNYSRVIHNLKRIWVNVLPDVNACYQPSLDACVLDERFVLSETMTLKWIASAIIHEATHARLKHRGIGYDEKLRPRIEAICLRRELAFATKLPDSANMQEEIGRTISWCATNHDYFSNTSFHERFAPGAVNTLRYLEVPESVIQATMKLRRVFSVVRNLAWPRPKQRRNTSL